VTPKTALIYNASRDPSFNLALEEHLLKEAEELESCIMIWQNNPSIIIGRYQNTYEEISQAFVEENKIDVIRRITGGGAVYHDLGNINFSFINVSENKKVDFHRYNQVIVSLLMGIGVKAELSSRNDITIDGKKFSGTAQYIHKNKVLHHGTLLYNSRLDTLGQALRVSSLKYQSKSVKSVQSRVTNICDYLPQPLSVDEFKNLLVKKLSDSIPTEEYKLATHALEKVVELQEQKYKTWEWNYGSSPDFNFKKTCSLPCGLVEVRLNLSAGYIRNIKVYGDFFGIKEIVDFENHLVGTKYECVSLQNKLLELPLADYFGSVSADDLIQCFHE